MRRQGNQMRHFLLKAVDGSLLRLAMETYIRHIAEPVSRCIVQVFQGAEGACVEQVDFHVMERPLHFALRLTPPGTASHGPIAIVSGEGQETRVVDRFATFVARHHDFHVVVQAGGRDASQILECSYVLANRRRKVLRLDEPQVLTPRVAQHIAEQLDSPPSLAAEVDRVGGVVHLGLESRTRLETLYRSSNLAASQVA